MEPEIFIRMALHAWNTQVKRADQFFDALPDDALFQQVSPGKNSIFYLLGHLIAVNDSMIKLFGLGDRSYLHLDEVFINNPDRSGQAMPEPSILRSAWKRSNEELTAHFQKMSAGDWFAKHTAMTAEDHEKEPSRNKLSVLLNRTSHVAYHLGQLMLVQKS